jgi:integrase
MVLELVARVRGPHTHVRLECRCSPYHQHSALYPLDLLQRRFEFAPDDDASARLAKLERGLGPFVDALPAVVPLYASLLSVPLETVLGVLLKMAIREPVLFVKEIFKHAVQWGYLDANPAQYVERPRVEIEEMEILTPPEIRRLLDAAEEPVRTLLLCAVLTGMRRGELLGLRWEDADLARATGFTSGGPSGGAS